MTLKSRMAADAAFIFNTDEFAEEVSFTPDEGEKRDIVVIPQIGDGDVYDSRRSGSSATGLMQVKLEDFPDGPPRGHVDIQGTHWKIKQQVSEDSMSRVVVIESRTRPSMRS